MRIKSEDGDTFEVGLVCDIFEDEEYIGVDVTLVNNAGDNEVSFTLSSKAAHELKNRLIALLEVE